MCSRVEHYIPNVYIGLDYMIVLILKSIPSLSTTSVQYIICSENLLWLFNIWQNRNRRGFVVQQTVTPIIPK